MNIILTMLPYSNHVYTPPIQLAYLKAYLQKNKYFNVKIFDAELYSFLIGRDRNLYWQKMWDLQNYATNAVDDKHKQALNEITDNILAHKPQVVGFSVTNQNLFFTQYVSERIKSIAPSTYIIYGGLTFCRRKGRIYKIAEIHKELEHVDCIVKNEGEETLLEVVRELNSGKRPKFIKGTTIRFDGKIIDGGERHLIQDIDTIPFPDFSDFKKEDYLSDYIRILFWRGCVGQCVYCGENYTMGTMRCRSAKNIVDEIELRLKEGYKRLQTCDLCLNPSVSRLAEVCDLIVKKNLQVDFTFGQFRHSIDLTRDVFGLLRRAGFKTVVFGTESGSQKILNKMRKGVKIETIEKNIRDAYKEGLGVVLFFMVGFPGETEETFLETMDFISLNKKYIDAVGGVNVTAVPEGTGFHGNLKVYNLKSDTLFKHPDRWETIDGKNFYEWRNKLKEKMINHISELGIPMADYYKDGNPRFPIKDKRKISVHTIRKELGSVKADKLWNPKLYSVNMDVVNISFRNGIRFILSITNTGSVVWKKKESDWIRVGCRIYAIAATHDNNAILELRQELPREVILAGESFKSKITIDTAVLPCGSYHVKFDMVNENRFWFEDMGGTPLIRDIELKSERISSG